MTKKSDPAPTQFTTQSIIEAHDWIGVWFDADEHGYESSSLMTEPVVCWALATWQIGRAKHAGVVGLVAGYPELYSPELLEDNFRGYCKKGSIDEFLENWDNAHVEEDPDEDSDEEDSEEGSDGESEEEEEEDDD